MLQTSVPASGMHVQSAAPLPLRQSLAFPWNIWILQYLHYAPRRKDSKEDRSVPMQSQRDSAFPPTSRNACLSGPGTRGASDRSSVFNHHMPECASMATTVPL